MKSNNKHVCATVFAALTIIGCCLSSMMSCHRGRLYQRKVLEDAVNNWEDEGGALPTAREEDEEEPAVNRR